MIEVYKNKSKKIYIVNRIKTSINKKYGFRFIIDSTEINFYPNIKISIKNEKRMPLYKNTLKVRF